MKINSGTINMKAERSYANSTQTKQATTMKQEGTGTTTYQNTSFLFSYQQFSSYSSRNPASMQYDSFTPSQGGSENTEGLPSDLYSNFQNNRITIPDAKSALQKFHEELIKRIEEFMEQIRNQLLGIDAPAESRVVNLTTTDGAGSLWTRHIYQSSTTIETECTTFSTTGSVVTADGRSIDFNIAMEMSRSFTETSEALTQDTQYILTDPLVIQLEQAPETISDQKWFFDMDGDGKEEELSKLSKGNAFLALDANGNGKIDNGNELFGTKSGNGFKDLAAYDEDGNGWIDENDSVYSKLKIWIKDAAGNDRLMDLKQGDIGAIYLGAAPTQFSHNSSTTNETQAVVRQTGIFLHESTGAAGTIQQIDFATK